MGYIRLIRSGGIHCYSSASIFLTIANGGLQSEKECAKNTLSVTTLNSAKNLGNEITHLHQNYAESMEYFRVIDKKLIYMNKYSLIVWYYSLQLLVEAFSMFSRIDKNPHMKLFYIIVPALILNYIEYIVAEKDNVNKKTRQIGCFTDDGFVVGLAFLLKLLNQNSEFDSLQWFKAVRHKYSLELDQLVKTRDENNGNASSGSYDAKLQQTLALTEKRINVILHEFDLLYCSLNSANIFFQ